MATENCAHQFNIWHVKQPRGSQLCGPVALRMIVKNALNVDIWDGREKNYDGLPFGHDTTDDQLKGYAAIKGYTTEDVVYLGDIHVECRDPKFMGLLVNDGGHWVAVIVRHDKDRIKEDDERAGGRSYYVLLDPIRGPDSIRCHLIEETAGVRYGESHQYSISKFLGGDHEGILIVYNIPPPRRLILLYYELYPIRWYSVVIAVLAIGIILREVPAGSFEMTVENK